MTNTYSNYRIHDEARFSFGGTDYLVKDFENANMRALEIYDLTIWAEGKEPTDFGPQKFVGYANELGFLGTLANYAFGRFDATVERRDSDDGICAIVGPNFRADFEPNRGSDGGLRVTLTHGEDWANPLRGSFENWPNVDSIRQTLGELEIALADRNFGGRTSKFWNMDRETLDRYFAQKAA